MNLFLWILAFVLAAVFIASGVVKLVVDRDQQIDRTPYVEDFPHTVVLGIGVLEILGGIGLVLPAMIGVAPLLVPAAAAGLAITMVFAALVHARRGDGPARTLPPIVLAIASVLLAWTRMGPFPL